MKCVPFFRKINVLIDWVGGPHGKIFGGRSGRADRAQWGPCIVAESQIFSRQARPNSVNFPAFPRQLYVFARVLIGSMDCLWFFLIVQKHFFCFGFTIFNCKPLLNKNLSTFSACDWLRIISENNVSDLTQPPEYFTFLDENESRRLLAMKDKNSGAVELSKFTKIHQKVGRIKYFLGSCSQPSSLVDPADSNPLQCGWIGQGYNSSKSRLRPWSTSLPSFFLCLLKGRLRTLRDPPRTEWGADMRDCGKLIQCFTVKPDATSRRILQFSGARFQYWLIVCLKQLSTFPLKFARANCQFSLVHTMALGPFFTTK